LRAVRRGRRVNVLAEDLEQWLGQLPPVEQTQQPTGAEAA
jgi:hypothetical protein